MKHLLLTLFLITTFVAKAQNELNAYKYIIVPKKFEAFKKENEHLSSTLVKHLLTEKGFLTVYADEMPEELNTNRCLGLEAGLLDNSAMFSTKTVIFLKDCSGKEVFRSVQGTSREKEYKAAYAEAIRASFTSFDRISYVYQAPAQVTTPITVNFKNDVKQIAAQETLESKAPAPVVYQEATIENQRFKSMEPVVSPIQKSTEIRGVTPDAVSESILYAQKTPNGYQLVDSTPKILYRLYGASLSDLFWAVTEDKQGMVFKKEGQWYFEYFENEQRFSQELQIKF